MNRLGLGVRIGLKSGNDDARNLALQQSFNVAKETGFVDTHQRNCFTACARTAGAADAMYVIFSDIGQIVIHHMRQLIDVDAARGDIGGHQHLQIACLELGQRLGTRALAFVAVDGQRSNAIFVQQFGEAIGAVFGTREHQHLMPVLRLDEMG